MASATLKMFTMRKHIFLKIMKCIHEFASLKNARVTVHKCLASIHYKLRLLSVKNSNVCKLGHSCNLRQ